MRVKLAQLKIRTRRINEWVEITRDVDDAVTASGVGEGIVLVRSRHTTAAITCSEPDPRLHLDVMDAVGDTFPLDRPYRHIEEGAENAVAHLATCLLFGDATWAAVRGARLDLGTWQHLYVVELYEPRLREIDVAILGE